MPFPKINIFSFFFFAPHISPFPLIFLFFFVGLKGKRVRTNEQKKNEKKNPTYLMPYPNVSILSFSFLAPHISPFPLIFLFFFVGLKGKRVRTNEQKKNEKKNPTYLMPYPNVSISSFSFLSPHISPFPLIFLFFFCRPKGKES